MAKRQKPRSEGRGILGNPLRGVDRGDEAIEEREFQAFKAEERSQQRSQKRTKRIGEDAETDAILRTVLDSVRSAELRQIPTSRRELDLSGLGAVVRDIPESEVGRVKQRIEAGGQGPGKAERGAFKRFLGATGRALNLPRTAEEVGQRVALGISRIPEGIQSGLELGGEGGVGLSGLVGGIRGLNIARIRELSESDTERKLKIAEEDPGEKFRLEVERSRSREEIAVRRERNKEALQDARLRAKIISDNKRFQTMFDTTNIRAESTERVAIQKLATSLVSDATRRLRDLEKAEASIDLINEASRQLVEAENNAILVNVPITPGTVIPGKKGFAGTKLGRKTPTIKRQKVEDKAVGESLKSLEALVDNL